MQGGKKGSGKGGNQKKGGSAIGDLLKPKQPFEQTDVVLQNLLIIENHRRKVGRCTLTTPSSHEACFARGLILICMPGTGIKYKWGPYFFGQTNYKSKRFIIQHEDCLSETNSMIHWQSYAGAPDTAEATKP